MTIRKHDYGSADFDTELFKVVQREEATVRRIYSDPLGIPTLGVGFALFVRAADGSYKYRYATDDDPGNHSFLGDLLSFEGINLIADDWLLLDQVLADLNSGQPEIAKLRVPTVTQYETNANGGLEEPVLVSSDLNRFSIELLDDTTVRSLYDIAMGETKEIVRAKLGSFVDGSGSVYDALADSEELAALLSLAYNSPKLIGGKLTAALQNQDRAEAWYEIQYNSNAGGQHANRRYREADLFGLYNVDPTEDDYKSAYRMLTRHKSVILGEDGLLGGTDGYEDKYLPPEAGMSIFWQLKEARDFLLPLYDQGVSIAWSNIQVGEDSIWYKGTDNDILFGSEANDLLFGDAGNDFLEGKNGDDVIYGGAGNDLYRLANGEGRDILTDHEGTNTVILNGTPVKLLLRQAGESDYRTPDGSITGVLADGHLTLSDATGARVEIRDFNEADYGLRLWDVPQTPTEFDSRVDNADPGDDDILYDLTTSTRFYVDSGEGNDYVHTGAGNDHLILGPLAAARDDDIASGNGGNDTIEGGAGSDVLTGNQGDDKLFGGREADFAMIFQPQAASATERDWLAAGSGRDLVVGGRGNDALFGGGEQDVLFGGAGDDHLMGDSNKYAVDATWQITQDPGNPNIRTFRLADGSVIGETPSGDGGDDTIYGGDGNDWIIGETGNDYLDGGANDDYLDGDAFDIHGALHGNDTLVGGDGQDDLVGNGGDDVLLGDGGNDILTGDAGDLAADYHGNDFLDGGSGEDYLFGLGGDDILAGGADLDSVFGGAGNDTFLFNQGDGEDHIAEESGQDTLVLGRGILPSNVTLSLSGSDLLVNLGGGDSVTLHGFTNIATRVERAQFTEGAVWDLRAELKRQTGIQIANGSDVLTDEEGAASTYIASLGADVTDGFSISISDGGGNDTLRFEDVLLGTFNGLPLYIRPILEDVSQDGNDLVLDVFLASDVVRPDVRGQVRLLNYYDPAGQIEQIQFADGGALVNGSAGDDQISATPHTDVVFGFAGNDHVETGYGDDWIVGGPGDDHLAGQADNDTYIFELGDGHDVIYDQNFNYLPGNVDTIRFGAGILPEEIVVTRDENDLVLTYSSVDNVLIENWFEDMGTSQMSAFSGIERIIFVDGGIFGATTWTSDDLINRLIIPATTEDADVRYGTPRNDTVSGLGGDDYIVDFEGDDWLSGDDGDDTILAGVGNDTVYGGAGNDSLDGWIGDDYLDGGPGDDRLTGGSEITGSESNNDTLVGGDGNDFLHGQSGDDVLLGGNGNDVLIDDYSYSVDGADILDGGPGDDVLEGGLGNDAYVFGRGYDADIITDNDTTPGNADRVVFLPGIAPTEITLVRERYNTDLQILVNGPDGTLDTLTIKSWFTQNGDFGYWRVESLEFDDGTFWSESEIAIRAQPMSATDDYFTGTSHNEVLNAGDGNDEIHGYGGADTLYGEAGDDWLYGGDGEDYLNGGTGNDHLDGGSGSDVIEAGDGRDNLSGGDGNDTLRGGERSDYIAGGNGDDLLDGGPGQDYLLGGQGSDTYLINGGFDEIVEYGNHAGIDTILFEPGITINDIVVEWNEGGTYIDEYGYQSRFNSVLWIEAGATSGVRLSQQSGTDFGVERFEFSDGTVLSLPEILALDQSAAGPGHLTGTAGNDLLQGANSPNSMYGDSGADLLIGYAGADSLTGGDGDDIIVGGPNNTSNTTMFFSGGEELSGGAGSDVYLYNLGDSGITGTEPWAGSPLGSPDPDYIWDSAVEPNPTGIDTISFGAGINPEDLYACIRYQTYEGEYYTTLLLSIAGHPDQIEVEWEDRFYDENNVLTVYNNRIERAQFIDGIDNRVFDLAALVDSRYSELRTAYDANPDSPTYIALFRPEDIALYDLTAQVPLAGGDYAYQYALSGDVPVPVYGTSGSDVIEGRDVAEHLFGLAGDDSLLGEGGNDTLEGGTGNDVLVGGPGDDTYVYRVGGGADIIDDAAAVGETNTLVFGPGIDAGALTLGLGSLLIRTGNPGDEIHIANFNPNDVLGISAIDRFEFADGTILTYAELLSRGFDIEGSAANDILVGTNTTDRITGFAGNDGIMGGTGDDTLDGGAGDDTYEYGLGDGNDTISDSAGTDTFRFGTDLNASELTADRSAYDLVIGLGAGAGLTVKDWFAGNRIERFEFADGTILAAADLEALVNDAPILSNPLADQSATQDQPFSFTVPAGTFADPDAGDTLTLSATLADGSALPAWLSFDPVTGIFGGTPGAGDIGSLDLQVTAGDAGGSTVSDTFVLTITSGSLNTIIGTEANDWLVGSSGPNQIEGLAGNDTIESREGDDILIGGDGEDYLSGAAGNDTYRFRSGDDVDWIEESDQTPGNIDSLVFEDHLVADVTVTREGDHLRLGLAGSDAVYLTDWFLGNRVERFVFADGETLTDAEIEALADAGTSGFAQGTVGDDYIGADSADNVLLGRIGDDELDGALGNDRLYGGFGTDILWGDTGADTLVGGPGDDALWGGLGDDIYVFGYGDGQDVIHDYDTSAGNQDTLRFGPGITAADLAIAGVNDQLVIRLIGTADQVTVTDWFCYDSTDYRIERLMFADGTEMALSTRTDLVNTLSGTAGDDYLAGYLEPNVLEGYGGDDELMGEGGDDRLVGGTGNDLLFGDTGADTYVFNPGDGQDLIIDNDPTAGITDTLELGVNPLDLMFTRAGDDLVVRLHGGTDQVTMQGTYAGPEHQMELFRAQDGSTLLNTQVDQLIQAMAQFSAENGGITWDQAIDQRPEDVQTVLASYWQPSAG